jgi:hypothetical protein
MELSGTMNACNACNAERDVQAGTHWNVQAGTQLRHVTNIGKLSKYAHDHASKTMGITVIYLLDYLLIKLILIQTDQRNGKNIYEILENL